MDPEMGWRRLNPEHGEGSGRTLLLGRMPLPRVSLPHQSEIVEAALRDSPGAIPNSVAGVPKLLGLGWCLGPRTTAVPGRSLAPLGFWSMGLGTTFEGEGSAT